MIAVLIGLIIFIIYEVANKDETSELELRAGLWVPVWFVGLTLISWLGSYPDITHHAGNLGFINTGWGIPVLAVFDLFIMWLAIKLRLPAEKIKKYLKEAEKEMAVDELNKPHSSR